MPEQPLLRTPMRMPTVGLPRPSISALARSAAAGVTAMTCGRGRRGRAAAAGLATSGVAVVFVGVLIPLLLRGVLEVVLLGSLGAVVGDRRLDRVLGQDRAVYLHRRQSEVLGDVGVLDRLGLVDRLALHPLGDKRARGDRRAATKGLELGVLDQAIGADLDLQLHHVAASRRTDQAGADILGILVERSDVARVLVVVDQLFAIGHDVLLILP